MEFTFLLSAIVLGFLGSFHCAGMCGPLLLMLPLNETSPFGALKGKLIYNAGRIFTYVILGLLFGLFGLAFALQGFQRELSILTGILILVFTLLSSGKKVFNNYKFTNVLSKYLRKSLKQLYSIKTFTAMFMIGMLNGLLPCGFVYMALAGAATSGSLTGGMSYMLLFGLGTFPMMMTLTMAANFFGLKISRIYSAISPFIAIILAIFLMVRGTETEPESCCKNHDKVTQVPESIFGVK